MRRRCGAGAAGAAPALDPVDSADRRARAASAPRWTSAGPGLADILWRIVCAGEGMRQAETALGWPARAGKLVLGLALDRIAEHYRIRLSDQCWSGGPLSGL